MVRWTCNVSFMGTQKVTSPEVKVSMDHSTCSSGAATNMDSKSRANFVLNSRLRLLSWPALVCAFRRSVDTNKPIKYGLMSETDLYNSAITCVCVCVCVLRLLPGDVFFYCNIRCLYRFRLPLTTPVMFVDHYYILS